MPKFLKPGKVVILTQGRHAGRKAVIVRSFENGSVKRKYPHALLVGIKKYPLKVTKSMSKTKIAMRSRVKPFIKMVNFAHVMPTRYTVELKGTKSIKAKKGSNAPSTAAVQNLKSLTKAKFLEPARRKKTKRMLQKALEARYVAGKNRWFFTKLRF